MDLEKRLQDEYVPRYINRSWKAAARRSSSGVRWARRENLYERMGYGRPFTEEEFMEYCKKARINPNKANEFPESFELPSITKLLRKHYTSDIVEHCRLYTEEEILSFAHLGFKPEFIDELDFPKHNPPEDYLKVKHLTPNVINKFVQHYYVKDIPRILSWGYTPEEAESLGELLYKNRNKFFNNFVGKKSLRERNAILLDMLGRLDIRLSNTDPDTIIKFINLMQIDGLQGLNIYNAQAIKTRCKSIVLINKDKQQVWKISPHIENERKILEALRDKYGDTIDSIVTIQTDRSLPNRKVRIYLDYIDGDTLEAYIKKNKNLLKKHKRLSLHETAQYCHDILSGLEILRSIGYYHKDLHPRNIIISKNKKAMIIDLDCSSNDPHSIITGNRSYGGNNDLISLGQLMYTMIKGQNLFTDTPFTDSSEATKTLIQKTRKHAYQEYKGMSHYYNKINSTSPGKFGGIIINFLDGNLWIQPDLARIQEAKKILEEYLIAIKK